MEPSASPCQRRAFMGDAEILVPEKELVKVGDRTYQIGELSIAQIIKLGRFVAKTILTSQDKLNELAKHSEKSESNLDDALKILELIDEDKISELFSIILIEDDIEFLSENLTPTNVTEIAAIICEKNIELLKKNVKRIVKTISPKVENG